MESQNSERPETVLSMQHLTKTYRIGGTTVYALRDLSLTMQRNEFVAVMGPSGSGKSTLLNIIGCLDRPTSGEYRIVGVPVAHMEPPALSLMRNQHIGFVFQVFHLLPRASALKNVALPLVYAGVRKELREQRAREVLVSVGLGNRLNHKPSQLSGGQQQRVAIARALINHPALLLADEPTGNLDSKTGAEIMAMLQMLHQRGLTIVIVTHDHSVAAYAQRQIELQDGVVVRDELNRLYDPHHSSGSEAAYNGPYNELQQDKGEA